jgi:hypothetical protein
VYLSISLSRPLSHSQIAAKTLAMPEPLKDISAKFSSLKKSDFMLQLEKQLSRAMTKLEVKQIDQVCERARSER